MSGHSKWATIKHKKGAADAKRAKLFAKLIRQVEVAARDGGGDLESNATLRTMYQKARDSSVPLDTIERAIKRGTGDLEGVIYTPITYEAYAPCGVALYIEVLTDNKNRTGADVRSLMTRNGGTLAEPGAVAWQFDRRGTLTVSASLEEDEVMMAGLDAGIDDLVVEEDMWRLFCDPSDTMALRSALEEAGIDVVSTDLTFIPQNTVPIESIADAKRVLALIDDLDDHDDVQGVYANFEFTDEIFEELGAE
ncbi:MAG: YebC/PmpR family DNA-binding transcriptional regulator [Acidimicrobiales bacterium]